MEKNNKPVDWGDIDQFQNEIDLQAEWLILRKKLQRKKKNRKLFLLFLSAASSFLLFIFWNHRSDHFVLRTMYNEMNLGLHQPESELELKTQLFTPQIETTNSSRKIKSRSHKIKNNLHHSQQINNLKAGSTIQQLDPNSTIVTAIQQSINSTIQQLNSSTIKHFNPNNTIGTTINQSNNLTIKQSNNLTIKQSNPNSTVGTTIEEPSLSGSMMPLRNQSAISEFSNIQNITLPEIIYQKIKIHQKPVGLSKMSFRMNAGQFSMNYRTQNKELNSYIQKLNSIEKPIYELGIASNLEFKLNNKFSLIGEINYRRQTSRGNNKEIITYEEENDDVLLEINRRPDGSEEQIRGKGLVQVNKTLEAEYFNSYHSIAFSSFLQYRLLNWEKSHFNLATGIQLGSYSWNNGYLPDQKTTSEYTLINEQQNKFSIIDIWMLQAEYSYDISSTMGIGMYCQYSKGLKSRPVADHIYLDTSSFLFGITIQTHL